MVNYCIINGVKSNTVKGLLIQSLPAISKPLIRTEIEEIDGRDGDIVTPLGYSAYDKEMTIGLYGDYDINDVIAYFDSQGQVTFSNEPDKYYNFQIIEQIDFERLVKYRTATVTFHVQPFKYSAVETEKTFINQLLSIPNYKNTNNGVVLSVVNGEISIRGTASTATEFYLPVNPLTLNAGNYTLNATCRGTGSSACSIRLIKSVPSDADSFGGNYLALQNDTTATMDGELEEPVTYNYLWFYITAGTAMHFTLDADLVAYVLNVINSGNTKAKPIMTLYGEGIVNLSLNGVQIFTIDIEDVYITIDASEMQAYKGNTFMNRYVLGDYDDLALNIGRNTLSWTGMVSQIVLENFSRWI